MFFFFCFSGNLFTFSCCCSRFRKGNVLFNVGTTITNKVSTKIFTNIVIKQEVRGPWRPAWPVGMIIERLHKLLSHNFETMALNDSKLTLNTTWSKACHPCGTGDSYNHNYFRLTHQFVTSTLNDRRVTLNTTTIKVPDISVTSVSVLQIYLRFALRRAVFAILKHMHRMNSHYLEH